jgi:hypothetical protein
MVGTISLSDKEGDRLHTIYQSATPESGKATVWQRMTREIKQVQQLYPAACYLGLADGAKDNWSLLESHTERQVLDFYHTTGYLEAVAPAASPVNLTKRQTWLEERCHQLKHVETAASKILAELKTFRSKRLGETLRGHLDRAITYFQNHLPQMNYAAAVRDKLPIGSGVTEAACKTVIKQRLGHAGMKWKDRGAGLVLSLRTLVLTHFRWHPFWKKISRYGLPQVA